MRPSEYSRLAPHSQPQFSLLRLPHRACRTPNPVRVFSWFVGNGLHPAWMHMQIEPAWCAAGCSGGQAGKRAAFIPAEDAAPGTSVLPSSRGTNGRYARA